MSHNTLFRIYVTAAIVVPFILIVIAMYPHGSH
jgi:hypothetical protein